MQGPVVEKFDEAIRLGSYQELEPVDIVELPQPLAELLPPDFSPGCKLIIGPRDSGRRFALRAVFLSTTSSVVYESIEFGLIRLGTEEVEIMSVQEDLPFVISVVLNIPSRCGRISFEHRWENREIHAVHKWTQVLKIVEGGAQFELHDVTHNSELLSGKVLALTPTIPAPVQEILNRLLGVSDKCRQPIHVLGKFSREDAEVLRFALEAVRSGRARRDNVDAVTFSLVKNPQLTPSIFEPLSQESNFMIPVPSGGPPLRIGQDQIVLGSCSMSCQRALLRDYAGTKEAFFAAKEGEVISVSFQLHSSLDYTFYRFLPTTSAR